MSVYQNGDILHVTIFFTKVTIIYTNVTIIFTNVTIIFTNVTIFLTKYLFDLRKINDGFCKENGDKNFVKIMVTT